MSCIACESPYAVVCYPAVHGDIVRCNICSQLYRYDADGFKPVKLDVRFVEEKKRNSEVINDDIIAQRSHSQFVEKGEGQ